MAAVTICSDFGAQENKVCHCFLCFPTYLPTEMYFHFIDEAQAGIKIARRNINNLRYTDDTTLMAESEELKNSLLMKVKEKSENG